MTEITEIWPPMSKQPEWAVEAIENGQLFTECFKRIDTYRAALDDIRDIAYKHDMLESADDLKGLVDDLRDIAIKAIALEPWGETI